MNVKPLLFCSLVMVTAIIGCVVVQDKPADSAPPPPAPTTAATDPAATATTTATAAPTDTGSPGTLPALGAAPRSSDAGGQ